MTFSRPETFRPIGQIRAADVLPALYLSQKLPLHISCPGVVTSENTVRRSISTPHWLYTTLAGDNAAEDPPSDGCLLPDPVRT